MAIAALAWHGALASSAAEEDKGVRLRLLAYNIHHAEGTDGRLDLARVARVIKKLEPDLVAVQEVDVRTRRGRGVDQAAKLGELTGMHHVFGKFMDFSGGEYGQAVLSKFPIKSSKNHPLPPGPEREVLVCITYIIVLFSIAAQGLTIGALVRKTSGV